MPPRWGSRRGLYYAATPWLSLFDQNVGSNFAAGGNDSDLRQTLICIKATRLARPYSAPVVMSEKIVRLDVRADIARGQEPFSKIMQTVQRLKSDEALLLVAPFEPAPLFGVMARQGFSHQSRISGTNDWEVLFQRSAVPAGCEEPPAPRLSSASAQVVEVDARGLEPPQPLVVILEALAQLPGDTELRARIDRRPMHLYSHLEERGFVGATEEQPDGSFVTHIRRA